MRIPTTKMEYLHYAWLVLRKRGRMIAGVGLTTFVSILFFGWLVTPVWEGTTLFLVERTSKQNLSIFRDVSVPVNEATTSGAATADLIPLLTGQNMAYDVVREFGLDERFRKKRQEAPTLRDKIKKAMAWVVFSPYHILEAVGLRQEAEPNWVDKAAEDFLEEWTDIEEQEGTAVISLTIYGETRELAMDIANGMVEMLDEKTRAFTRTGAENSRSLVDNQLREAEANLKRSEMELAQFQADNNLYSADESRRVQIEKIEPFRTELLGAQKRRRELEAELAAKTVELAGLPETVVVESKIARNPVVEDLERTLVELQLRMAALLSEKQPEHPDVQIVKAEIESNRSQIREAVESVVESQLESLNPIAQALLKDTVQLKVENVTLSAKEAALQKIVADLEAEIRQLPEKELELARLQQLLAINRSVYDALKTRLEKLAVEQQSLANEYNIRVIDRAYVPPGKDYDWPSWPLNIFAGLFLGFVFGFGIAFVLEYWNEPVISRSDVEEILGLPFLGHVADLNETPADEV